MRYVERDFNLPSYYGTGVAARFVKAAADFRRQPDDRIAQESPPLLDGAVRDSGVATVLRGAFHGKCAFCETFVSNPPIRRFRPPSSATPASKQQIGHLYYYWLSDSWLNLHPCCDGCDPDPHAFPVQGARVLIPTPEEILAQRFYPMKERPQFIDPSGEKSIDLHLAFRPDGTVEGRTTRGRLTVSNYHLDRLDLVARRHGAFAKRLQAIDDLVGGKSLSDPAPFDFKREEFAGAWLILINDIAAAAARIVGQAKQKASAAFFEELGTLSNGLAAFRQAKDMAQAVAGATEPAVESHAYRAIKEIVVENFKAIADLTVSLPKLAEDLDRDRDLPPLAASLLILGENSAGKSSILEAVALTLCNRDVLSKLDLKPERLILDTGFLGEENGARRDKAEVSIRFHQSTDRSELTIARTLVQRPLLGRPVVFAYGAYRHFIEQTKDQGSTVETLFRPDWVLNNPETWLLGLPPADFEKVVRTLRPILSIETEFDVIERDTEKRRCFMVQPVEGGGTLRAPLYSVSSGYRSMLAMACDILRGLMDRKGFDNFASARAVVLIDEIEAHLHPRWKIRIMRALRDALPGVTFIATTHDPLCLRGMRQGEVVVLQRFLAEGNKSGPPVVVEALTELPVTELTVEQLLTSDLFGLMSADDSTMEMKLNQVADALVKRARSRRLLAKGTARRVKEVLTPDELKLLQRVDANIADELPVGSTEVQRLVQDAVALYLDRRRKVVTTTDRTKRALKAQRAKAIEDIAGYLERG